LLLVILLLQAAACLLVLLLLLPSRSIDEVRLLLRTAELLWLAARLLMASLVPGCLPGVVPAD
jgi:hypothetical protein